MRRELRLSAIRGILEGRKISSQEELVAALRRRGFSVTQATLSRDLRDINVRRLPDGEGGYYYGYVDETARGGSSERLLEDFMRGFVSLEFSGTLGVVKTLPGHAAPVAYALDNLGLESILGTVAGDDTILVIPRDGLDRRRITRELREKIPGIEESVEESVAENIEETME